MALGDLGGIAAEQGDYVTAQALIEESLAIQRELGHMEAIAFGLMIFGGVLLMQGDYLRARGILEESLAIGRQIGARGDIAYALASLGQLNYLQEDYVAAAGRYRESVAIGWEIGRLSVVIACLAGLGSTDVESGQEPARGARLLAASEALLQKHGFVWSSGDRRVYERGVKAARRRLGEEAFARACAEGQTMSMEQAVACVLEEIGDG